MKKLSSILSSLCLSCAPPNIVYTSVPVEFYLDTWWAIEQNAYLEDGTCFLLNSEDNKMYIHLPEEEPYHGFPEGEWTIEGDHFLLEDVYGYNITIWIYGDCENHTMTIKSILGQEEGNIHKCEF